MKKAAIALLFVLAALALAACGGGSSTTEETSGGAAESEGGAAEEESGTAGSAATIKIEASPTALAFKETEVTAKAGEDTVDFNNPASIGHNVTIEDSAGKVIGETETITEGPASTTVDLKPGTYTYYCSVPGHREAGMEGTLVVE
ncbi:MAG TPA: plastocyanin/azurin family copper-binding protein [Solirubrobacterales bacterium]|nr:plastocyanin/azurin family copper-binding protein [Solirubrobacterales bacterium]